MLWIPKNSMGERGGHPSVVSCYSFSRGGPRSSFDFQLLPASPLLKDSPLPRGQIRRGVRQRLPTRWHLRRTAFLMGRGSHCPRCEYLLVWRRRRCCSSRPVRRPRARLRARQVQFGVSGWSEHQAQLRLGSSRRRILIKSNRDAAGVSLTQDRSCWLWEPRTTRCRLQGSD